MAALEGANHIVRHVNAAFCGLIGGPARSLIGKPCGAAMPVSAEWLNGLDRVFRTGEAECLSMSENAGQTLLFHTSTLWPLMSDGVRVGVMVQVTDAVSGHHPLLEINQALVLLALRQGQLIEEAERARIEAEAASKAKDRFMAVLSHELRTPLTPILMEVHTLTDGLPPRVADAFQMIERNVEFEMQLIDEMLDFTAIERGKLIVARDAIDLCAVVRDAVEVVALIIANKQQRLTLAMDQADHRICGDARRLRQVFTNLLKNALKFTPQGGDISMRSHADHGSMTVEISDTGIGFSAEARERIFEAFIGESGGTNLYAYVGNSPTSYIDPLGLLQLDPVQNLVEAKLKWDWTVRGIPPPAPGSNSTLIDNIHAAANHSFDPGWFYDQVKNKGPWDYKQCDKNSYANQAFGNFNYGSAGSAMFIPPEFLRRMAGWAQTRAGTSNPEWGDPGMFIGGVPVPGTGRAPFGDDPDDQCWINGGIQYCNQVTHPRR